MGGSLGWRGVGGAGISFDSMALYYFQMPQSNFMAWFSKSKEDDWWGGMACI